MKVKSMLVLCVFSLLLLAHCSRVEHTPNPVNALTTASLTPSHTPSSTPSLTPSLTHTDTTTPSLTPTPTQTLTPTPTPTIFGGFPGKYLLVSKDEAQENHILGLYDANGDLLEVLYSLPVVSEVVNDIGARKIKNGLGYVSWSPYGSIFSMHICETLPDATGKESLQCRLNLYTLQGEPILADPPQARTTTDWSPDGQWLAYIQVSPDGKESLRLLKTDGSTEITLVDRFRSVGYPIFSPDGTQVLYWAYGGQLRLVNTDGSQDHLVWEAWWGTDQFNWSPDGSKIVLSRIEGWLSNLYYVDPDGSNRAPVARHPDFDLRTPIFSPDGKYILFDTYKPDQPRVPHWGNCYYTLPADLSAAPKLVGSGWEARWSPDNSTIILHGWPLYQEQDPNLLYEETPYYAVAPDASGFQLLGQDQAGLAQGIWQPGSTPDQAYHITSPSAYQKPQNLSLMPVPDLPKFSDFLGTWANKNPQDGTISEIEIKLVGDDLVFRIFKEGDFHYPETTFLGEYHMKAPAVLSDSLQLIWKHPETTVRSDFILTSPAHMQMVSQIYNPVAPERESPTSQINLMRISGQTGTQPYTSCPPVLGDYNPENYPPIELPTPTTADSTATLSLTPTPDFEIPPIYDSFGGTHLNHVLWDFTAEFRTIFEIYSADGNLEFKAESVKGENYIHYMDFRIGGFPAKESFGIQTTFRVLLEDDPIGSFGLSLVSPYHDTYFSLHCATRGVRLDGILTPAISFDCQPGFGIADMNDQNSTILSYGDLQTLTMIYNPKDKVIQVYLNGKYFDSLNLPTDYNVNSGIFYPKISFGMIGDHESGSHLIVQLNEVRITTPKYP